MIRAKNWLNTGKENNYLKIYFFLILVKTRDLWAYLHRCYNRAPCYKPHSEK